MFQHVESDSFLPDENDCSGVIKVKRNSTDIFTLFLPNGWHGFISDQGLEISRPCGKLFRKIDQEGSYTIICSEDENVPPIVMLKNDFKAQLADKM